MWYKFHLKKVCTFKCATNNCQVETSKNPLKPLWHSNRNSNFDHAKTRMLETDVCFSGFQNLSQSKRGHPNTSSKGWFSWCFHEKAGKTWIISSCTMNFTFLPSFFITSWTAFRARRRLASGCVGRQCASHVSRSCAEWSLRLHFQILFTPKRGERTCAARVFQRVWAKVFAFLHKKPNDQCRKTNGSIFRRTLRKQCFSAEEDALRKGLRCRAVFVPRTNNLIWRHFEKLPRIVAPSSLENCRVNCVVPVHCGLLSASGITFPVWFSAESGHVQWQQRWRLASVNVLCGSLVTRTAKHRALCTQRRVKFVMCGTVGFAALLDTNAKYSCLSSPQNRWRYLICV